MRAIVLSGGGAKGSYEIGVWKALKKLNIKYDIVTGTSVGALNGALMVQKTYLKGLFLWHNISYDDIFEMNDYSKEKINKFYKDNILKGGVEVDNLEGTVKKCIKPHKFFKSKIKYGLITVKFPSMRHVDITKEKLTKDNLSDYLVASASCFPAFKTKKIDENTYIDGGYYDNLPINLAIDLGATEIIAVDLKAIGRKQKPKKQINITYISPRNKIDSFLKFDKVSTRRGIRLGYNDTMKLYEKLDGNMFTFKKNHLNKNIKKYKKLYNNNLHKVIKNSKIIKKHEMNELIEKLGYLFEIDDSHIYNIKHYNKLLIKKFDSTKKETDSIDDTFVLKKYLNNKLMVKYFYDLLINKKYNKLKKLSLLYPNEFLMSIYIKTIKGA